MLNDQWARGKFLTVSLNPRPDRMPKGCGDALTFLDGIIAVTGETICCYQIDPAFLYPVYGSNSLNVAKDLIRHIHEVAPLVPVIADINEAGAKHTVERAGKLWFGEMGADAITVCAYHGRFAFLPVLEQQEKGVIVNCRTTDPEASEFQDAIIKDDSDPLMPLYRRVAWRASQYWDENHNCALAIGAKHSHELKEIRNVITQCNRPRVTPFFIYGISSNGPARIEETVKESVANGQDDRGMGFSVVTSRTVLYASQGTNCFTAAKAVAQKINTAILSSRKMQASRIA
ncbi:MAG: hypothetical protein A2599_03620 [Candidatus Staskawiczbacteria bacterium RIFOXYD1_FULL_39_28]|uniref:Orotidine 5'-phosphate decarboxylase n=1 Tax=Candidatus Staskawiczbacteria bacterium RIFOXYC1_FULL_38_18 TaxID=1802229 RepID=A0A1G2JC56_9BACT|nr:MAG: hypothetical protein A2401_01505 [Candidatus Staskawiczbacteria bacterium RIFOXYC1_FULL_38_18]OGZ91528.1 MAG: hypothetical protein A2599_03620 [Candidatus Staskawiczbacteria bacterium RIFOXYD1_FULL_39_28]